MSHTERQSHGFQFEEYIEKIYGVDRSNSEYTAKWDGMLNGYPVSIKVEKYGTDIEMADFRRNAENIESFYLIVGFWNGSKNNIIEIQTLFIDGGEWHQLFPEHFINDFSEMLNNITNEKCDDAKWRTMMTTYKNQWTKETNNLVRPRFKRDHKRQKRIQCAINNKDFYNYFVKHYGIRLSTK